MLKDAGKHKAKGSVLYTVVAVMMIMTVFIFAALALASSANRRAFNSYANNQTQYTARSVIDSIWEAMNQNESFANQFASLTNKGDSKEIDVTLPNSDSSMGKIVGKPTVTLLGKGMEYGYNTDKNMYKISATVKMIGQENTLAGYFIADKIESGSPFDYALVSLGDNSVNTLDNLSVLGGTSTGSSYPHDINIRNTNALLQSPANINGNLTINAFNAHILLSKQEEGAFVNGSLQFVNSGNIVRSDLTDKVNYIQLPYLYVRDKIEFNANLQEIGSITNPVIVMADTIDGFGSSNVSDRIYGDLYLYSQSSVSNLNLSGLSAGVQKWSGDAVNKQDNRSGTSYTGGNIYSLGTLNITGENGQSGNNVIADTLNLNHKGVFQVYGASVANTVNLQKDYNGGSYMFYNGLFTDPDNFTCEENISVNNIQFNKAKSIINSLPISVEVNQLWQPSDSDHFINYDLTAAIPSYNSDMDIIPRSLEIEWEAPSGTSINKLEVDGWFIDSPYFNQSKEISGSQGKVTFNFDWAYRMRNNDRFTIRIKYVGNETTPYNNSIYIKSINLNTDIYDIDTSGNLEFLKNVNDYAFSNNEDIIYIDDIDKSVKLEKYADTNGVLKLKISKAEFKTPFEEGNELDRTKAPYIEIGTYDYVSQYADFLKSVVNTAVFPDTMKRDQINGSPPDFVDDSFLEQTEYEDIPGNKVPISKVELEAKLEVDKAFDHIGETSSLIYTFNGSTIECSDGTVYNSEDSVEITSSCTFTGYLQWKQISIKPASSNIYIKLDNFNIYNMQNQTAIVVDDSGGTKKVNFLIPKNCGFYTNGSILTKTYNEMDYFDIIQNPDVQDKIPGITFYMEYDKSNTAVFNLDNKSVLSGYIMAPTSKFSAEGGSKTFDYTSELKNSYSNLALIGGIVFKDVSFGTACAFAYVNPNALNEEDGGGSYLGNPDCLYYQCY